MRMRSISVVCLAVALTMGLTSSAFALEGPGTEVPEAVSPEQETTEAVSEEQAAPEYSPTERKEILEEQENVVEELMAGENLTDMTQRELDQTIQEVLKEEYQDAAKIGRSKTEEEPATDGQHEPSAVEQTYELDDSATITFRDRTVQVTILEEGAEYDASPRPSILARALDFVAEPSYAAKKGKKTGAKKKTGECKTIIYDSLTGWKCFTVYVKARFTYNRSKKTCTVATLSHYAKKGSPATILSEVHDREYLISKESDASRTCTQSGYIRTGINYKGNGIVTSDYYASASVSCNYKGKITTDSTID